MVFVTIFYLGVDIVPKANWPFVFVFESLKLPVINNFRYIVLFGLTLVSFRIIANFIFAASFAITDLTNLSINKVCIAASAAALIASVVIASDIALGPLLEIISIAFGGFNIVFMSLTSVVIMVRKKLKLQN